MSKPVIRQVRPDDGEILVDLMDIAGQGFVLHLFRDSVAPGQTVRQFIVERVGNAESGVSYTKSWVAEVDGRIAGYIALDAVPADPDPVADDTPPIFRPMLELEQLAPGTTVINMLATLPDMRGRGIGSALLRFADTRAGPNGLCLTVLDSNAGAQRLYRRHGYRPAGRRPVVKNGWDVAATDWLLMVKP